MMSAHDPEKNVFGEPLAICCRAHKTGFMRTGYCQVPELDQGHHSVCAQVSEIFLAFSLSQGNDLITPRPEFGFFGLQPGQCWCLCASRWLEAHEHGVAPKIRLRATNIKALDKIALHVLKPYALDVS